jgi:hypothetical protein
MVSVNIYIIAVSDFLGNLEINTIRTADHIALSFNLQRN